MPTFSPGQRLPAAELNQLAEAAINYTTISSATNFDVSLNFRRLGGMGFMSVTATRINSNVGATTALIATVGSGGRGDFSTFTQPLAKRGATAASIRDSLCWYDAITGQVTMQWFDAWNIGATVIFGGAVLLDSV